MAAATLAVKVVAASLTVNRGATASSTAGTPSLVLVLESTATAGAVPLAVASASITSSDPTTAKGMVGKALTLNYDDTTGAITSLT